MTKLKRMVDPGRAWRDLRCKYGRTPRNTREPHGALSVRPSSSTLSPPSSLRRASASRPERRASAAARSNNRTFSLRGRRDRRRCPVRTHAGAGPARKTDKSYLAPHGLGVRTADRQRVGCDCCSPLGLSVRQRRRRAGPRYDAGAVLAQRVADRAAAAARESGRVRAGFAEGALVARGGARTPRASPPRRPRRRGLKGGRVFSSRRRARPRARGFRPGRLEHEARAREHSRRGARARTFAARELESGWPARVHYSSPDPSGRARPRRVRAYRTNPSYPGRLPRARAPPRSRRLTPSGPSATSTRTCKARRPSMPTCCLSPRLTARWPPLRTSSRRTCVARRGARSATRRRRSSAFRRWYRTTRASCNDTARPTALPLLLRRRLPEVPEDNHRAAGAQVRAA